MPVRRELELIAPIPVGNHVTLVDLERRGDSVFEARWAAVPGQAIVCDDSTQIAYARRNIAAEGFGYGALRLAGGYRLTKETLRGVVVACSVLSDFGDAIQNLTILDIEPDADAYR